MLQQPPSMWKRTHSNHLEPVFGVDEVLTAIAAVVLRRRQDGRRAVLCVGAGRVVHHNDFLRAVVPEAEIRPVFAVGGTIVNLSGSDSSTQQQQGQGQQHPTPNSVKMLLGAASSHHCLTLPGLVDR